jgi:hypothetical protein
MKTACHPHDVGYWHDMTEGRSAEEIEAIQIVADRVGGYQDGAPEVTVRSELERGLAEAGLKLSDDEVATLASTIEAEHGTVDVATLLG